MSAQPIRVDADTTRPTKADLGLVKLGPGAERLLGAMVKRGLNHEHLPAAATIALVLEERAIR